MLRLQNISVRNKLLLLSVTLLIAVGVVGATGYRGIMQLTRLSAVSEQQFEAIRTMAKGERLYDTLRAVVFRAWIAAQRQDQASQDEAVAEIQNLSMALMATFDALENFSLEQEAQEAVIRTRALVSTYVTKADEIATLAINGRLPHAEGNLAEFQTTFTSVGDGLQELGLLIRGGTSFTKAESESAASRATQHAIVVLGAALFVAVVLSWAIAHSIVTPLLKMTYAARRIATGEISQRVDHLAKDETGALADAFRELISYIQGIAEAADRVSNGDLTVTLSPWSEQDVLSRSFTHMVENLREMNGKVQEGTKTLSVAIAQILGSVSQVAGSTTETATAITQTATTIGQVKQIALQAADRARTVAATGEQAAVVSNNGEAALTKAEAGLKRIREQMESIADSVIHLGEHSTAIATLLDTIDEIAEQSSLLAVNAAIEAANAGEMGRGFAVIARAIKLLADRSKDANGQIKAILNHIQKASHVTVLVTEQGTKSVQAGVAQSLEAGASLRTLSTNIAEAARAMTQITVSSEQQLLGIDQVVVAMENIQRASTQNAVNMTRIQTAAQNLSGVGASLSTLVQQYHVTAERSMNESV